INVETWFQLQRLALREVDLISLVSPSFGLSRSSFLGDESGMRDGLPWAINKSLLRRTIQRQPGEKWMVLTNHTLIALPLRRMGSNS
ncbi:hypothetical protein, partial [Sutterella massiliensis]|uniref:hypothetical protein n=1 Tax=Sutterella massiliensis TaxID=1816689 RepID=UPI0019621FE2